MAVESGSEGIGLGLYYFFANILPYDDGGQAVKAVILTGGLGTRLRPFTCEVPKPLLPVANRPFLRYQLKNLRRHGVRDVILAVAYLSRQFSRAAAIARDLGMRLRCVRETKPLGTGGAVGNVRRHLEGTTLILNGDVLQALDVTAFARRHRRARAEISINLIRVDDPTKYGLVETAKDGRVLRFLEKPSLDEAVCDTINAGAYLFEPSAVDSIPKGVVHSLERGLFPRLVREKRRIYGFTDKGYWLDIGTLEKYLKANLDVIGSAAPFPLDGVSRRGRFLAAPGARLGPGVSHAGGGRVLLGKGTRIAKGVRFIGSVCVGDGCVVEAGATLESCVLLDGARVGAEARLDRCVVGRRCRVGRHASLGPGGALGGSSILTDYSEA